jgi:hypothetical protein
MFGRFPGTSLFFAPENPAIGVYWMRIRNLPFLGAVFCLARVIETLHSRKRIRVFGFGCQCLRQRSKLKAESSKLKAQRGKPKAQREENTTAKNEYPKSLTP